MCMEHWQSNITTRTQKNACSSGECSLKKSLFHHVYKKMRKKNSCSHIWSQPKPNVTIFTVECTFNGFSLYIVSLFIQMKFIKFLKDSNGFTVYTFYFFFSCTILNVQFSNTQKKDIY